MWSRGPLRTWRRCPGHTANRPDPPGPERPDSRSEREAPARARGIFRGRSPELPRRPEHRPAASELGVDWTIAIPSSSTAFGEPLKAQGRILRIGRADDGDPEIHQRHPDPTNCRCRQRSVVEIVSFDQQVRESRNVADVSHLGPEFAGDDSCMKTPNRFSLHNRPLAYLVVSSRQQTPFHIDTELDETLWNAVDRLPRVHDHRHRHTMAGQERPVCRGHVPLQIQLALSRSESA